MPEPKDVSKKKQHKIQGTLVKVTDENIDEVAEAIVEKIRKVRKSKDH